MVERDLHPGELHPDNVDGPWFVDTRCIRCDVARHWAPELIGQDRSGQSFLARQPTGDDEEAAMWRAKLACPTQSIRCRDALRPETEPFPFELTPGVFALGHNAQSSFGAHSWLLPRPDGNVMFDAPRFDAGLVQRIDAMGGIDHIVLSHRDDVADAEQYAERFASRVWIHEAEIDAAPFATDLIDEGERVDIAPGVVAVPAPGHTVGHVVLHVDERFLFTGDTLHWNRRRESLDVFPRFTFYSWDRLADTVEALAELRVEWVFPGHGMWHRVDPAAYAEGMLAMARDMRVQGQDAWSSRPDIAYDWF